jgi:5'-nucleotidase
VYRPAAWNVNRIVRHNVPADSAVQRLVGSYTRLVRVIANAVIGYTAGTITKTDPDGSGDTPLGNLIADSQRAFEGAVASGDTAPADIAFMNPGGIRADLEPDPGDDRTVTYGAAFTVQPFNNYVVSMDMTGEQIRALLEQQWTGDNEAEPIILQVSGLTYTWDPDAPLGSRVVDASVQVDTNGDGAVDAPLVDATVYRVVANSFLSDGGDGFPVFTEATDKYVGGLDIDALQEYLAGTTLANPYQPTPTDRISVVP